MLILSLQLGQTNYLPSIWANYDNYFSFIVILSDQLLNVFFYIVQLIALVLQYK